MASAERVWGVALILNFFKKIVLVKKNDLETFVMGTEYKEI